MPARPSACRAGESSLIRFPGDLVAAMTSKAMISTIMEWPMANQNPTDLGLAPSAVSLRVVLSMAAM